MKHPIKLDYVSLDQLAEDLGNLRYDALAYFLHKFANKLQKDSSADEGKQRHKLSEALSEARDSIKAAKSDIEWAWRISEPYMKE